MKVIGIALLIYVIEAIKYSMGMKLIFQEEVKRKWCYMIGLILMLGFLFSPLHNKRLEYTGIYFCAVIAVFIGTEGKLYKQLGKFLMIYLLLAGFDESIVVFVENFEKNHSQIENIHLWMSLISSAWGLLVLSIVYFFAEKRRKKKGKILSRNSVTLIILINGIVMINMVSALNAGANLFIKNQFFQSYVDIAGCIANICICLLCWLLMYLRGQNEEQNQLLAMERELNESQSNFYQALMAKEEETRKFRHDLNNHLFCLANMANKGDLEGTQNYLKHMMGEMNKISQMSYRTENELFDVLLNEKRSHLPEATSIEVQGKFLGQLELEDIDLCTIFSNLFQNAVEELKQQQEGRVLIVKIKSGKKFTEVTIENSVRQKVLLQENGLPKTSKGDKKNHGIGLENVRRTVERCNGKMEISSEQERFSVKVILENRKKDML